MTDSSQIVDILLGEAIDHDAMLRDIGDVLKQEQIDTTLRKIGNLSLDFGFIIGTGDPNLIEDNLREDGIDPKTLDWASLADSFTAIERNLSNILAQNGIRLRHEGHDRFGDLTGTAWVDTFISRSTAYEPAPINRLGLDLIKDMLDSGEPLNTSSGSIMLLKGSDTLFQGVDPMIERAADVTFGLFATEKIKRFFDGLEDGEDAESLKRAVTITEERFLAPRDPPGIFRKVIDGVEIYSARCPGCKRIHGNFRTYDQAAGNRQCKFCTRDFVDKMTKVRTTGNFKHIIKKDHEARASRSYR